MKPFLINLKTFVFKYFEYVVVCGWFAYVMLFGSYNIIGQLNLKYDINQLEKQKQFFEQEIVKTRKNLQMLNTGKENLERQTREKYLMHKADEDVFIVREKS